MLMCNFCLQFYYFVWIYLKKKQRVLEFINAIDVKLMGKQKFFMKKVYTNVLETRIDRLISISLFRESLNFLENFRNHERNINFMAEKTS